jgi:hypothetical protein
VLVQLKGILKENRRRKVTKLVLFLHNNATGHQTLANQNKLAYLDLHLPYFLDLAPSDYHLFAGLKKNH